MTAYVVYKSRLLPSTNGQFPDVEYFYIREGLPHISYTKDFEKADRMDKDEAEEIAFLTDSKILEGWT